MGVVDTAYFMVLGVIKEPGMWLCARVGSFFLGSVGGELGAIVGLAAAEIAAATVSLLLGYYVAMLLWVYMAKAIGFTRRLLDSIVQASYTRILHKVTYQHPEEPEIPVPEPHGSVPQTSALPGSKAKPPRRAARGY